MDISVKDALDALRPVAIQARAAIKLADVLGSLVGVENHRDELEKQVAGLKKKVEDANAVCDSAYEEAVKVRDQAVKDAAGIVQEAKDRAAVIAAECKASVADCTAELEKRKADADAEFAACKEAQEAVEKDISTLIDQRNALVGEVEGLRSRLKGALG